MGPEPILAAVLYGISYDFVFFSVIHIGLVFLVNFSVCLVFFCVVLCFLVLFSCF